jgi:transcriptional regulator with XRE-family HTH domain
MTWAPGPIVTRRRLGGELKRLRDRAGFKLDEVASRLECSPSKISRLENGKGLPKWRDVRDMLDAYGVGEGDLRSQLLEWARTGQRSNWWSKYADVLPPNVDQYMAFEWDAECIRSFEPLVVHGLLQTEDYARAVLSTVWIGERTSDQIERMVEARLFRHRVLSSDHGLQFCSIIDESTLHRRIGSPTVMIEQIDELERLSRLPNVELRIFPYEAGLRAPNVGAFAKLSFSSDVGRGIIHIERPEGSFFYDATSDVDRYGRLLDDIYDASLSPEETRRRLAEARRQH